VQITSSGLVTTTTTPPAHAGDSLGRFLGDAHVDLQQVHAVHARLARHPGGEHHHVRAGDGREVSGTLDLHPVAAQGGGVQEVQGLALRQAFHQSTMTMSARSFSAM